MTAYSKPLRLHELLGRTPEWTDQLWDDARLYLADRLSLEQSIILVELFDPELAASLPLSLHKETFLAPFRKVPPTLLLGVFDMARTQGLIR